MRAAQRELSPRLQGIVREEAARLFPEAAQHVLPGIVALPAGIHPYNRNSAYFDPVAQMIVLYQHVGRLALRAEVAPIPEPVRRTVQHELAHWFQHVTLGYTGDGRRCHRHRTWGEACFRASLRLWPDAGLMRKHFAPFTSTRVDGKVQKVPRAGALSDVALHHWPDSMPDFLGCMGANSAPYIPNA
jgi:hypothetical protein